MSAEIQISASIAVRKGGTMDGIDTGVVSVTMTGNRILHHRQSVGFAAEEALVLGEVPAGGLCLIINRDATNYVQVRRATGQTAMLRIPAGEFALFRFDAAGATAPFVIANTAAVEIEVFISEA